MIELIWQEDRLTLWIRGKVDAAAMRDFIPRALIATEGVEHGQLLMFVGGDDWPTLGAVATEILELPKMIQLMRRFDKVAVITDKDWLGQMAEIEGLLIPGLKVESFDLDELREAEMWLDGIITEPHH